MRNNLAGKNVLAYTGVSTKDQKDFGNSLGSQKKAIANFCKSSQLNVIEFFEEDFSAKNFNRPIFKELKEFAKKNKGRIDYLLVQKWDRFSRNVGLALQMIEYFKKLGIEVNSIENWIDYDAPDYIVILSIYLSTPEAENSKIRDRTIAGTREALKQGRYVNAIPKGYISGKDQKGKTLMKQDPVKAPLIKNLFEDFATGLYSQQDLVKKYNLKGLNLSKSSLSRLLDNPLYMGMVRVPKFKDEPEQLVKGLHSAIISKETYYIAQEIKNGRVSRIKKQRGKNENFPLTGFLICAECGGAVYGSQSNNGTNKKVTSYYNYYQCNSKCKCKRYRAEVVHNELEQVFATIKPSEEILDLFQKILIDEYKNVKTDRLQDIQSIDRKMDDIVNNQMQLTEKFGLDKIKEDIYNKLMDSYEMELIELRASKAELGDYQQDLDKYISFGLTLLTNLDVFYKNVGVEVKTKLLGSLFTEKLVFQNNTFRTLPFNEVVTLLCRYNKDFGGLGKKKGGTFKSSSHIVPGAGIEPALHC